MNPTPSTEERAELDEILAVLVGIPIEFVDQAAGVPKAKAAIKALIAATAKASEEGDELVWLQNRCPACKRKDLFVGKGAWITCANADCPQPDFEKASEEAVIEARIDEVDKIYAKRTLLIDAANGASMFVIRANDVKQRRTDLRKALNIDQQPEENPAVAEVRKVREWNEDYRKRHGHEYYQDCDQGCVNIDQEGEDG